MIAEIQSRMFRPHAVTVGMRQHVTVRTSSGLSKHMAKVVALIICFSLVTVFAFSQVMHWHIEASAEHIDKLQSVGVDSKNKNIELLAMRAQLASQEFVEKKANERLQLFVPQRNQIRRL